MAFLYDRTEKSDEIIIVYKYQTVWYLILLVFIISIPFTRGMERIVHQMEAYVLALLVLFFVIQIGGKFKPDREIKQAMKNGKVQISGSTFSFNNPITYTIKK